MYFDGWTILVVVAYYVWSLWKITDSLGKINQLTFDLKFSRACEEALIAGHHSEDAEEYAGWCAESDFNPLCCSLEQYFG